VSGAGRLDLAQLRAEVESGAIETVVTALPDLYGRLVGKRITGHFFLDEVAGHGMHACDYLLACDMEMDPTPGYAFASWETGTATCTCVPTDDAAPRRLAREDGPRPLRRAQREDEDLVAVAPRSILKRRSSRARHEPRPSRRWPAASSSSSSSATLRVGASARATPASSTRGWYIEDYHVLSGHLRGAVVGAIRRHLDAPASRSSSKGEWGPGQHEINLRYARRSRWRPPRDLQAGAKEVASSTAGGHLHGQVRRALRRQLLHLHSSLWSRDTASRCSPARKRARGDPKELPERFRWWLGGLLRHARAIALLFAPTSTRTSATSRRLLRADRASPGRTTTAPPASASSAAARRCASSAASPAPTPTRTSPTPRLVAAGLDGIENKHRAAADVPRRRVRARRSCRACPHAAEAIARVRTSSALQASAFGEDVVEHLLHFARTEQAEVRRACHRLGAAPLLRAGLSRCCAPS
jgi:glutamine synthetase